MSSTTMLPLIESHALHVRPIVTTIQQTVDRATSIKWSLRLWLGSICRNGYGKFGRNEFGQFDFSLSLGYYTTYTNWTIPAGTTFNMLELATVNTDWTAMVSTDNFHTAHKIRVRMGSSPFQFRELRTE